MNVMALLEYLYEELNHSATVPLTGKRLVDVEKCLDIVSELRVGLPDDVKEAEHIVRDRDQFIKEAELQAKDIIREAEHQFEQMVSQNNVVAEAQRRAQDIVNNARRQANDAKLQAEDYVEDLLAHIEEHLVAALDSIRDGQDELDDGRGAPPPPGKR